MTARTQRATTNGAATVHGVNTPTLEEKVDTLIWLHTELAMRYLSLATALAGILAQQAQPQVQQAILAQLLGASKPGAPG